MIDVLFIAYNRPTYTARSLSTLLGVCDAETRVFIWQNGTDPETLAVVRRYKGHPRVARYVESSENKRLREPTNWFFAESTGTLIAKVDDDLLIPAEWAPRMREAHAAEPRLGVLGAWPFMEQDTVPEVAERKVRTFAPGVRVMMNCWVNGGGFVMKRKVFEQLGPLKEGQSFPNWCNYAARAGWLNGWLYPFVYTANLDDPRHPECRMKTQEDFEKYAGLSLTAGRVRTLAEIPERLRLQALDAQSAPYDPGRYVGLRAKLRRGWRRGVAWARSWVEA